MKLPYTFSYTMEYQEVYEALVEAGIFKTSGKRKYIYAAILFICGFINVFAYFTNEKATSITLFSGILCFGMIVFIFLLPEYEIRKRAKKNVVENPVPVTINEDKVEISQGEGKWEILYDECFSFKESTMFLILYSKAGRVVAFPKKCIEKAQLPQILSFFHEKAEK